jgi:hypothetical protein
VVGRVLVVSVSLVLVASAPGCGSVGSSAAGINAPCTRDSDCANGLSCQSGVCAGPLEDAGSSPSDAAVKDAPADG